MFSQKEYVTFRKTDGNTVLEKKNMACRSLSIGFNSCPIKNVRVDQLSHSAVPVSDCGR